MRSLLFGLSTFLTVATTPLAHAGEARALLIGASTYPALDPQYWLKGPANDVALVAEFLRVNPVLPFASEQITVLADGLPDQAPPTLQAIRAAFAKLTEAAQEGDFIYIHFSGHGSQMPAVNTASELDGLDEVFLPVDIGPWSDTVGTVANALVDDEIGQMLDALRAKGADVWVVFDSCHSGTATRAAPTGDTEVRMRQLPPSALAIPQSAMELATSRALPPPQDPRAQPAAPVEQSNAATRKGNLTAFFAAQTNEVTPEMMMPPGQEGRRLQGVFTYTLFQTLAEHPGLTYRQLAQEILRKYSVENLARSTPLFEGNLDARVFNAGESQRILQWPVTTQKSGLSIPAGSLHGLQQGMQMMLLASPADPEEATLAQVTVQEVTTFSARSDVPADVQIPKGAVLRQVSAQVDFQVTVALPESGSPALAALQAALEVISRDGLAGPRLTFVAAGQDADLRLAVLPDQPDTLRILDGSGLSDPASDAKAPSLPFSGQSSEALATSLTDTLRTIAKAINLLKVGQASGTSTLRVKADLIRARFDPQTEDVIAGSHTAIPAGNVPRMIPDDVIGLSLSNPNEQAVDFNILYIGADYSISFMENGRMQPGSTLTQDYVLVTDEGFGRDRMLVILTPAPEQGAVEDLSFLAQGGVSRTRSATGTKGFAGLLDEAGFGQTTRAAISLSNRRKTAEPAPLFLQFEIDTLPAK